MQKEKNNVMSRYGNLLDANFKMRIWPKLFVKVKSTNQLCRSWFSKSVYKQITVENCLNKSNVLN